MTRPTVLFLGPCRKLNSRTGEAYPPFAEEARSGKFLRKCIRELGIDAVAEVDFDNILPGCAIDSSGKEYNPSWNVLLNALDKHKIWGLTRGSVLVALSEPVCRALTIAQQTRSNSGVESNFEVVCSVHPSYVMRRPAAERIKHLDHLRTSIFQLLRPHQELFDAALTITENNVNI
ncbi:hypothetical protein DFO46_4751 [Rhizobium sp. AG855]|nr:hypothetical protein DFO46_4751 [Rhizobium sp. AG855]